MKKILTFLMALVLSFSLFACSPKESGTSETGGDTGNRTIWIAFAENGYGREYLEAWIDAFQKAYLDEGWEFELEGDPEVTGEIYTRLSNNNDIPDLFFGLETSWQQWALRGYLEPLDDVYAAPADENLTIEQFLRPEALRFGKVREHYYAIPWSDSANGFIYNVKMFRENGWEVPKTVNELYALCDKINNLAVNKDSDKNNDVAPFAWGGQVISYWDFVVQQWWAQYEGAENYNKFFTYSSPDVFAQRGRLEALKVFEKLVVGTGGEPKNSYDGAMSDSHILSQMAFLQGKAAMIPMGGWMETEMKKTLPDRFEMAMMPTPFIDGAKTDANGNPIQVNCSSAGDFFVLPKNAPNKEGAKKFLKFINTREMCYEYTRRTGVMRPFNYKPSEIPNLQATAFAKSCLDIYENSVTLYQFSDSPLFWLNYCNKWAGIGAPYGRMVQDNETAEAMFNEEIANVNSLWNRWKSDAGL